MNRRRFLLASSAIALSGCASTATYLTTLRDGRITVTPAEHPELSNPGGAIALKAAGLSAPVLLLRVDEGYVVFSATCPHLGCNVRPSRHALQCPCHGSTFDLGGDVLRGPAPGPLSKLVIRPSGENLEIILPISGDRSGRHNG